MLRRLLLISVATLILTTVADAQAKKPAIGNFPFWSMPKRDFADQFAPGLNAALLLSDEQIIKLQAARQETIDNEQIRPRKDKEKDANLPEAEKEARRKAVQEAYSDLRIKASNILTPEQRRLIEQINAAHLEATTAANAEFEGQLTMAKGNEELQKSLQQQKRDRIAENFKNKLDAVLSPEQKQAWENAAAQEIANAAKPKAQK